MMFIKDLLSVIPNSDYRYRKDIDFKSVVEQAKENGYTSIVVVNEDQKRASILLTIIYLFIQICFTLLNLVNLLQLVIVGEIVKLSYFRSSGP